MRSRTALALIGVSLALQGAWAAAFRTQDPLGAFIRREYPPGDDYFIHGAADTIVFRCVFPDHTGQPREIALSEISIWGNRTGPWEIFRRESGGGFVYVGTRHLSDTSCLESCRTRGFLASGRCSWQRGWPPGGPRVGRRRRGKS